MVELKDCRSIVLVRFASMSVDVDNVDGEVIGDGRLNSIGSNDSGVVVGSNDFVVNLVTDVEAYSPAADLDVNDDIYDCDGI